MKKFEVYDDCVIYTNGKTGALLEPDTGYWHPFAFFDDGTMDVYGSEHYTRPWEAACRADKIFT